MILPVRSGEEPLFERSDIETDGGKDERFPGSSRLRARRQFLETRRRGRRAEGRWLVVYAAPNQIGDPRLGVTVTRRVGNAAVRNHWKRRLREIFRRNKGWFGTHDVVIIVKSGAKTPPFEELKADVQKTVRRALSQRRGPRGER